MTDQDIRESELWAKAFIKESMDLVRIHARNEGRLQDFTHMASLLRDTAVATEPEIAEYVHKNSSYEPPLNVLRDLQKLAQQDNGKIDIASSSSEEIAKMLAPYCEEEEEQIEENVTRLQASLKRATTDRKDMPSIAPDEVKVLQNGLQAKGLKLTMEEIPVTELRFTQKDIYIDKIIDAIEEYGIDMPVDLPVVVSATNDIIDGNHRVANAILRGGKDVPMQTCLKVPVDTETLVDKLGTYGDVIKKTKESQLRTGNFGPYAERIATTAAYQRAKQSNADDSQRISPPVLGAAGIGALGGIGVGLVPGKAEALAESARDRSRLEQNRLFEAISKRESTQNAATSLRQQQAISKKFLDLTDLSNPNYKRRLEEVEGLGRMASEYREKLPGLHEQENSLKRSLNQLLRDADVAKRKAKFAPLRRAGIGALIGSAGLGGLTYALTRDKQSSSEERPAFEVPVATLTGGVGGAAVGSWAAGQRGERIAQEIADEGYRLRTALKDLRSEQLQASNDPSLRDLMRRHDALREAMLSSGIDPDRPIGGPVNPQRASMDRILQSQGINSRRAITEALFDDALRVDLAKLKRQMNSHPVGRDLPLINEKIGLLSLEESENAMRGRAAKRAVPGLKLRGAGIGGFLGAAGLGGLTYALTRDKQSSSEEGPTFEVPETSTNLPAVTLGSGLVGGLVGAGMPSGLEFTRDLEMQRAYSKALRDGLNEEKAARAAQRVAGDFKRAVMKQRLGRGLVGAGFAGAMGAGLSNYLRDKQSKARTNPKPKNKTSAIAPETQDTRSTIGNVLGGGLAVGAGAATGSFLSDNLPEERLANWIATMLEAKGGFAQDIADPYVNPDSILRGPLHENLSDAARRNIHGELTGIGKDVKVHSAFTSVLADMIAKRNKRMGALGGGALGLAGFLALPHLRDRDKQSKARTNPKPKNPDLWEEARAEAAKKYPDNPTSLFANQYASKIYKKKGGKWKKPKNKTSAVDPETRDTRRVIGNVLGGGLAVGGGAAVGGLTGAYRSAFKAMKPGPYGISLAQVSAPTATGGDEVVDVIADLVRRGGRRGALAGGALGLAGFLALPHLRNRDKQSSAFIPFPVPQEAQPSEPVSEETPYLTDPFDLKMRRTVGDRAYSLSTTARQHPEARTVYRKRPDMSALSSEDPEVREEAARRAREYADLLEEIQQYTPRGTVTEIRPRTPEEIETRKQETFEANRLSNTFSGGLVGATGGGALGALTRRPFLGAAVGGLGGLALGAGIGRVLTNDNPYVDPNLRRQVFRGEPQEALEYFEENYPTKQSSVQGYLRDKQSSTHALLPGHVKASGENEPTDPELWSKMKAKAKKKFDVYPSAYANQWAAKQYKEAGGGWRKKKESAVDRETLGARRTAGHVLGGGLAVGGGATLGSLGATLPLMGSAAEGSADDVAALFRKAQLRGGLLGAGAGLGGYALLQRALANRGAPALSA